MGFSDGNASEALRPTPIALQELIENGSAQAELTSRPGYVVYAKSGILGQGTDDSFPLERYAQGCNRPRSPIDVSFAFKSRTNFIANFVRDLRTNIRDFSAMNLQSKRGQY
jgi:hypothetical protein